MTKLADMSPDDSHHIAEFVRAFVPKHRQPRWLTVLAASPKKWSALSMDDVFEGAGPDQAVRLMDISTALERSLMTGHAPGVMFRLSSPPGVVHGTVAKLAGELADDDAIISIVPGRVALASHHSDGWALCRR